LLKPDGFLALLGTMDESLSFGAAIDYSKYIGVWFSKAGKRA
jgi:hypothetical protein